MIQRIFQALTFFILTLGLAAPAGAQELRQHQLRSVAFAVPADWRLTNSIAGTEMDFASPDGRYTFWARWWFPDEPLLGYGDIRVQAALTLAGQPVQYIHAESGGQRRLTLAFDARDARGEQFLLQLFADATRVNEDDQRRMLETLANALIYDGVPALAPPAEPAAPQPVPGGEAPGLAGLPTPEALAAQFGGPCRVFPVSEWQHPSRAILEAAGATPHWIATCRDGGYPVLAAGLPYDPRAATVDFFLPLYDNLLTALGDWAFALVEPDDGTVVALSRGADGGMTIDLGEMAATTR